MVVPWKEAFLKDSRKVEEVYVVGHMSNLVKASSFHIKMGISQVLAYREEEPTREVELYLDTKKAYLVVDREDKVGTPFEEAFELVSAKSFVEFDRRSLVCSFFCK